MPTNRREHRAARYKHTARQLERCARIGPFRLNRKSTCHPESAQRQETRRRRAVRGAGQLLANQPARRQEQLETSARQPRQPSLPSHPASARRAPPCRGPIGVLLNPRTGTVTQRKAVSEVEGDPEAAILGIAEAAVHFLFGHGHRRRREETRCAPVVALMSRTATVHLSTARIGTRMGESSTGP